MAEWLRRLGDLAPRSLQGPMAEFLAELERDGRVIQMELRLGCPASARTESATGWDYESAAVDSRGRSRRLIARLSRLLRPRREQQNRAAETILQRFLDTHALVGLDDILGRYPLQRELGAAQAASNGPTAAGPRPRTANPEEHSSMVGARQSGTSSTQHACRACGGRCVTCPPQQFADFLLRWHFAHPDCRQVWADGLTAVLARLEGLPLPAAVWEQAVLPARMTGLSTCLLDESLATGQWIWAGQGGENGAGLVCFLQRETSLPNSAVAHRWKSVDEATGHVLECLRIPGAFSFPTLPATSA